MTDETADTISSGGSLGMEHLTRSKSLDGRVDEAIITAECVGGADAITFCEQELLCSVIRAHVAVL